MGKKGPRKTILCWSSGKDSAWTLHRLRGMEGIEVVGLMTTLNSAYDRVSMHGVRRELVEMQAAAVGLPIEFVAIPDRCAEEEYDSAMAAFIDSALDRGVDCIAYGDLFLEDVRAYRESRMLGTGLDPIFPLWGGSTAELAAEMCRAGLKARIVCVDPSRLDTSFIGRDFDEGFVGALSPAIDPCGERGEYHSFAYDGPMFSHPVRFTDGVSVDYRGFHFLDILPVAAAEAVA